MTGEIIALGSAALYALAGVAIARGAADGKRGDNGAFLSVILTAVLSLLLWLATETRALPAAAGSVWKGVALFVAAGLFSTVLGRIAMFRSVERGGAVRASMLRRLTPVFAAVFAALLLSELPGWGGLAGMALILGGAAMLGGRGGAQAMRPGWLFWGAGSAAAYGFSYVLRKMALALMPGAAALGALIGALTGLAWYVLAAPASPRIRQTVTGILRDTGPWQFVAAAAMALGQIGQFLALARSSVATVAVIGSTETVISIILAGWVFRTEPKPGPLVWTGAAISTAGVVLVALQGGA